MTDPPTPAWGNLEAEKVVRRRYLLAYLVGVPITGYSGALGFFASMGRAPVVWSAKFLLVGVPFVVVAALVLGHLSARAVILLSVPRLISKEADSFVGDYRRPGWSGPPLREIRFEDIRWAGKTRILRIPILVGHPDYHPHKTIADDAFFYLSEENLRRVREVILARPAMAPTQGGPSRA